MKLDFDTASVEIFTHSEFQHSTAYGFRPRISRKIDVVLAYYCYITLSEIAIHHTFVTKLTSISHKVWSKVIISAL